MAVTILARRGTAAEWTAANPILAAGEFGYETDTKKLKVGDGSTQWTSLGYTGAEDVIPPAAITAKGQIVTGSDTADYAVLSIGSAGQVLVEDPVAGTFTYGSLGLNDLSDVSTSGAVTNDLFARGSSQWEKQSFSAALTPTEETVRQVIANGDMTKRRMIGVAGYFSRGNGNTPVYKWSFPADTVSTTTAASANLYYHAGFANPAVAGYFSRGLQPPNTALTTVYKWAFPADTVSTSTAAPAGMQAHSGFANPAVAGYFSRGLGTTTVYKWAFPADTVTTATAAPDTMSNHTGFANPAVAGYSARGLDGSFTPTTTVYKWAFPADTASTTTASPAAMRNNAGFADPAVAGYFGRGLDGSFNPTTAVYKWSFPADTVTTTTAAPAAMGLNAGFANPAVAGYFARGESSAGSTATVYKWSFPADTVTTTTAAPTVMSYNAGFANA